MKTKLERENADLKKWLQISVRNAMLTLARLDALMISPSTFDRGTNVAKLCNELDLANDQAARYGLDWSFKKIKAQKKVANGMIK